MKILNKIFCLAACIVLPLFVYAETPVGTAADATSLPDPQESHTENVLAAENTAPEPAPTDTATTESATPDSAAAAPNSDKESDLPQADVVPKTVAASGFANIHADAHGNSIIITWDEPGAMQIQQAVIYRSNEPITKSSIESAKLIAKIPAGQKIYTDKVPDGGMYYYGIMPEQDDGAVMFVYNPLENTTTEGTATGITEMTVPAEVVTIDAQSKDEAVIIRYSTTKPGNRLILYRAATPLTDPANLVNAVIISVFTDSGVPFIDYPLQGIPCYYGLIDENKVRTGNAVFVAGKNATTVPVYAKGEVSGKKKNATKSIRSIPLPYLSSLSGPVTERKPIDAETEKILNEIIKKINATKLPEPIRAPAVFTDEKKEKTTGEALLLKSIIEGSFTRKEWNVAEKEILKFLELNRSEKVTARSRFYLGEVYYFSGRYREALTEFLFARSLYYVESQEWIQYTLSKLDSK